MHASSLTKARPVGSPWGSLRADLPPALMNATLISAFLVVLPFYIALRVQQDRKASPWPALGLVFLTSFLFPLSWIVVLIMWSIPKKQEPVRS